MALFAVTALLRKLRELRKHTRAKVEHLRVAIWSSRERGGGDYHSTIVLRKSRLRMVFDEVLLSVGVVACEARPARHCPSLPTCRFRRGDHDRRDACVYRSTVKFAADRKCGFVDCIINNTLL